MAIELFGNCASCVAGSTSGTTSPAQGATESWTMSTGYGSFPSASNSVSPITYFYIRDPADTTNEIVEVTNVAGTTFSVIRGACGTTPVAHATGATWVQVIAPGTLQNFKQASNAATSPVTVANSVTETVIATYQPVTGEVVAGTTFQAVAFGLYQWIGAARPVITWRLRWGGVSGTVLAMLETATNCPALTPTTVTAGSGFSFDVNGTVVFISTTSVTANLNWWYAGTSLVTAPLNGVTTNTNSSTGISQSAAVTVSGSGPLVLTFQWGTQSASNSLTATAPAIYREA